MNDFGNALSTASRDADGTATVAEAGNPVYTGTYGKPGRSDVSTALCWFKW